jgi:hypothetical protein
VGVEARSIVVELGNGLADRVVVAGDLLNDAECQFLPVGCDL